MYSDLNLITLGVLVERVTGTTLDTLVRDGITDPLGMVDTGYNPPASKLDRIAATEYQAEPRPRAWSAARCTTRTRGRSAASPATRACSPRPRDLAVLGQAILNGGTYAGKRILRPETVEPMLTNYNAGVPRQRARARLRTGPALVHGRR